VIDARVVLAQRLVAEVVDEIIIEDQWWSAWCLAWHRIALQVWADSVKVTP
jgi:hypothetical protein